MQWMVGGKFPGKNRYKGVRFNTIGVTKWWMDVKFKEKSSRNTEWPHTGFSLIFKLLCPWTRDVVIDIFNSWVSMISYYSNDKNESSFPQHALDCVSVGSRQFLDCCGYQRHARHN